MKDDPTVEIARMGMRQGILVAIITALATVVVTLMTTWANTRSLERQLSENDADLKGTRQKLTACLERPASASFSPAAGPTETGKAPESRRPEVVFGSVGNQETLVACKGRGHDALRRLGASAVIEHPNSFRGSLGAYAVVVSCMVSQGIVVPIVSGPELAEASTVYDRLASFLEP